MRRCTLYAGAQSDFNEAYEFLENRESGLGMRFRTAIIESLKKIMAAPDRWPKYGEFRKYLLPVFNYRIFYKDDPDAIRIIAIAHSQPQTNLLEQKNFR